QMLCGDTCLDVLSDSNNCGGCGIPCLGGQVCQNGACGCASGIMCNGACAASDSCATGGDGSTSSTGGTPEDGGTGGTAGSGPAITGTGGAPAPQTTLVTSGPSGGYWQTSGQLTTVTSGNATVTVNDTSTAQTW